MRICTKVIDIKQNNIYTCIKTNNVEVRVWFLTDEIIRIRAGFDGDFTEESYSLMLTGWEDRFDKFLGEKRTQISIKKPIYEEKMIL